jgi:multimeric flavodoxin WrbA
MRIIAINGSARKNWNTHILLSKALEGAKSVGAQTELINLYDLNYKGCMGCLLCKAKSSKRLGHCAVNDDLKPLLEKIDQSDGLLLGSPIYLGEVTAMLRAFWERFIFQYLSYDDLSESLFQGHLKTAFIYTMNATDENLQDGDYRQLFKGYEGTLMRYFEYAGAIKCTETLQMEDYSRFHMALLNEDERRERRENVFPEDCQKAYELGKSMAQV